MLVADAERKEIARLQKEVCQCNLIPAILKAINLLHGALFAKIAYTAVLDATTVKRDIARVQEGVTGRGLCGPHSGQLISSMLCSTSRSIALCLQAQEEAKRQLEARMHREMENQRALAQQ